MSHPSKVEFMKKANLHGYRVYLYYIATEDPEINKNRVEIRIAQQGHSVSPDLIAKRYIKSLEQLISAVRLSHRAYIFDNSGEHAQFIGEVSDGSFITLNSAVPTPVWVVKYLINKN